MAESSIDRYTSAVLDNLAKTTEGGRWFALRDAAFTFGGLIGSDQLDREKAESLLFHTATAIGLGEKEIAITMQSALDAGSLAPLTLDNVGKSELSPEKRAELENRRQKVIAAKKVQTEKALKILQGRRPDLAYHKNLNGQGAYVKKTWGLNDYSLDAFKIGFCEVCPTSTYSPSITIPYYWHEKLINVRHRLLSPNGSGKYRPEVVGLPSMLFNASVIDGDWIILVEGEFKAIVLTQYGFPAVAIPGASNYKLVKKTLGLFKRSSRVYVALDPGAEAEADKIGDILTGGRIDTRLVTLPVKPDDFFVIYGGTPRQFSNFIQQGKRV